MKLTLGKITSWLSGIGLLLIGVIWAFVSVLGAIITVLVGLFALPPIRTKITDATGVRFSRWLVFAVIIVGATVGTGIALSNVDTSDENQPPADDGVSESIKTTAQATSNQETESVEQTPEPNIHEMEETFTVGSGDNRAQYMITDVSIASEGEFEEPDGVFVIVEFEIKNDAQQSFRIDEEIYTLEDNQGRQYDADTPFGLDNSIGFGEQVDPGVTQSVTVAFDVPPNQTDRRLLIEPAGTFSNADTHQVILTI
jgi:hypothetical protein